MKQGQNKVLWWGNCGPVLCFGDPYKPEQVSGQGHQKVSGKEGENGLKNNCYIGASSIILPNVKIGPNTIIGAGSVVTKDIPPNSIAAGNPARVISSMENYREKVIKLWSVQRPPGYLSELVPEKQYESIYIHQLFHLPQNQSKLREHLINLFAEEEINS